MHAPGGTRLRTFCEETIMLNRSERRRWALAAAAMALCWAWAATPTKAQRTAGSASEAGLMPMIPAEAVFFVERRGHEAIRPAMLAANFGKMAADEAILQFAHDSRTKICKMIVQDALDLDKDDTQQIDLHQKLLHQALKPLWYRPCALFVTFSRQDDTPGIGFLCLTGRYRKETGEALAALLQSAVQTRRRAMPLTYRSGLLTWRGLVDTAPTTMPAEKQEIRKFLARKDLFMVAWHNQLLCVATRLSTLEAVSKLLSAPGPSKIAHAGARSVLAKTAITDWAFRWHVDVETIFRLAEEADPGDMMSPEVVALGLDKVRGIGGAEGYADGVSTRFTYVDAPKADRGLPRLFARGGSYKRALAMTPDGAGFALGGQLDTKVLMKMIRDLVVADSPAATRPALGLEPGIEKALKLLNDVAEAAGGDVTVYATDLQSMMTMGSGDSLPFGAVLSIKQTDKAIRAVDELIALAEADDNEDEADDNEDEDEAKEEEEETEVAKPLKMYRKVAIRRVGEDPVVRIAMLKDRLVLALGDPALKAAIDTALDDIGGFEPDSQGAKLMAQAGEGSGFFTVDLAGLARLTWPILSQWTESDSDFPFASLPSTQKMVRLLGPEVAVFEADEGGLMMKSRGKVPFATKAAIAFPVAAGMVYMAFRGL